MKNLFGALLTLIAFALTQTVSEAFPMYYDISEHDKAQAEAQARHLPLAWLGSYPEALNGGRVVPGGTNDLTQVALAALQDNAVVIFFDGRNMAPLPPIVHAQFHIHDDGELANNVDWYSPKVVFSNADVSRMLGRVSDTQLKSDREAAINSALQIIRNDPTALNLGSTDSGSQAGSAGAGPTLSNGLAAADWLTQYGVYVAIGLILAVGGLIAWGFSLRSVDTPKDE